MQMAMKPMPNMASVCGLRKTWPSMVPPIARPRNSVTILAISFSEALVSRATTPDSRMKLPSMMVPMRGRPLGASRPVTRVTTMGKSSLV